jgi:uncharacterized protein YjiS (DUF1127 family)
MPHTFDFDRYLREFPMATPMQRDAMIRAAICSAKAARGEAIRQALVTLGRWFRAGAVWSFNAIRPTGVAAGRLLASGWRRYQDRRRRRLAAMRLHAMDDRMLKDIGLRRGEIDFVLSGVEDPTRIPRPAPASRDRIATLRPRPHGIDAQRADALVLARNACAG